MTWDELVAAFRAIGGVAENARLDSGPFGRGIFPVDQSHPVRLFAPKSIQVRTGDIQLRDGAIVVASGRYEPNVRVFFERYQAHFGWGAGGSTQALERQREWHAVPATIGAFLRTIGALPAETDWFAPPSPERALREYLRTRQFLHPDGHYIMPIIDLVNHSGDAPGYTIDGGCGVEGTFAGEVFVNYASADSLAMAVTYGFAPPAPVAFSISAAIALPDGRRLLVTRAFQTAYRGSNVALPKVEAAGNDIHFEHLTLGLRAAPDVPRGLFRKLAREYAIRDADTVFDAIAHYNRTKLIALLRLLRGEQSSLARMLEEAVVHQLDTMSYAVGARAL